MIYRLNARHRTTNQFGQLRVRENTTPSKLLQDDE
jgi:hypothetical protein